MSLVNKVTKSLRYLRWSTICAILFYMFFIGLILHSTSYKLQHTLRSRRHNRQPDAQQPKHEHEHSQQQLLAASASNGNNALLLLKAAITAAPAPAPAAPPAKAAAPASASASAVGRTATNNHVAGNGGAAVAPHAQSGRAKGHKEPETVIFAASSVNEKQILEKAFRRADKNQDSQLTIQELAYYINRNIVEHIDEAIRSNPREFRQVDVAPADGLITWEEYHRFFLREHGMSDADINEHNEIKHAALNRRAREDMMRDKARWSEAARTDLFSLTIDEYLSFRHPESSVTNLLELVDDLLRQFDQDGDDQLTLDEFCEVTMDDDDDLIRKALISKTVVERREEFRRIIDRNADGKADRGELLDYVNPKTPRYALQEAATLFSLCDENKDGKLTLSEMVSNPEIFLTSKVIDTANSFHTEF